jgi:hypothetical protein
MDKFVEKQVEIYYNPDLKDCALEILPSWDGGFYIETTCQDLCGLRDLDVLVVSPKMTSPKMTSFILGGNKIEVFRGSYSSLKDLMARGRNKIKINHIGLWRITIQ